MTVRYTSITTYHDLKSEGIVGNQEFEIIKFMFAIDEPQTLKEISRATGLEINVVSARVNTLKKKDVGSNGILIECDKRMCTVSGRNVTPVRANQKIFHNSYFDPQHITQTGMFKDDFK